MPTRNQVTGRRPTLADVAARAGVSKATASLVLRNAGSLQPATRERVRQAMQELGYVYHRGAASMRGRRTFSVGLVVPSLSNPFTAELATGAQETLDAGGLVTLLTCSFESTTQQDRLVASLLERQVDGVILFAALHSQPAVLRTLLDAGIPTVVTVRNTWPGVADFVGIDNVRSGALAAEHLVEHGCRRLAFAGGHEALVPRQERLAGIAGVLAASPTTTLVSDLAGPATGDWARGVTDQLFPGGRPAPDGLICHSDVVAFGIYRGLRDLHPDLVDSLRVVSHDNVAEAALFEPPLTSVSANGRDVGTRAAEVLVRRLEHPADPVQQILLAPTLQVRSSCGEHDPAG